jgi:hypothetical protein
MSSSERGSARSFLVAAISAATLATLAIGVLNAYVDPYGYLREASAPERPCGAVVARGDEALVKPRLASLRQPTEVLLGTSRVGGGFDETTAATIDARGRVVNLGVPGADMARVVALARSAIDSAPVERIWVGVDFGMFHADPSKSLGAASSRPMADARWLRWATALLSWPATRASLNSLTTADECSSTGMTFDGFIGDGPRRRWLANREDYSRHAVERIQNTMSGIRDLGPKARVAWRLAGVAHLSALLAFASNHGVAVMLYVSPSQREYYAIMDRAGLAGEYAEWRDEVATAARGAPGRVTFVDFSNSHQQRQGARSAEGDTDKSESAFYDLVHFTPRMGRVILESLLRRESSSSAPL